MDFDGSFEDTFVDTGRGRMHYRHHRGNGSTIIFLHGFAASARTWKRFVPYLPDRIDAYLIDLLGHGSSDAPVVEYNITLQMQAVRSLAEKEHLDEFYLFGHSYGGWVAALYAIRSRVSGIVLEDCAGLYEFREEKQLADPKYREQMIKNGLLMNPRRNVITSMADSAYKGEVLTKEMLAGLSAPTLLIWGEEDDTVELRYGELMHRYINGSRMEIVKGAGHTPHYSNPEETSRMLVDFIGPSSSPNAPSAV